MRLPRIPPGKRLLAGLAAAGLIVAFCLGLVWANPRVFWNDDYQISILPVLADVARSWREGHWPLLSPYSWACGNLAGEYQYGTFSLFVNAVVLAVFALPLDFAGQAAALSMVHLAMLGSGAYLLARGRRLPAALATVVALIAALNGWEIGWGATDWFGALAADAWLPWCWWAFEKSMREENNPLRKNRLWRLLPVPFVYLLLTGGFPYTVVRLALVTAWLGARAISGRRWRALWPLATGWVCGLMLSAPAWLSLLEYIRGSHRSQGAGVGNFAWTVPWYAWPGLILPNWTTPWRDFANLPSMHAALELTGGLVPLAGLAAFAVLRGRSWRVLRWDLVLLGTVVVLCVLPSPGMFRWSFRWLPLFHLVFALAGARALHAVISRHGFRWMGNAGLWATVLTGAAWLVMVTAHTANGDAITRDLPLWTFGVVVGWFALAALLVRRRAWALWVPVLATGVLLWVSYRHLYTNPGLPKYGFGPSLARTAPLSPDRLYLSLYLQADENYRDWQTPPDFGAVLRPGSTGMFAGIHTVNGYSPIMPSGVGQLWNMETHGSIPEDVGRRLVNGEDGADALLKRLGIDGLLIAHDYSLGDHQPADGEWELVHTSAEGTVYHRRYGPCPEARAWTQATADTPSVPGDDWVRNVESSRLSVTLDLAAPAEAGPVNVVFRRAFFPGYAADLDGRPVAVSSDNGLAPCVSLSSGSHGRLRLSYRPQAVVWGGVVAAMGLLAMGAFALWTRRSNQDTRLPKREEKFRAAGASSPR